MKNDTSQLRKKVEYLEKNYGFDGIYHFTDFGNLKSIFSKDSCSSGKYSFICFSEKGMKVERSISL